MAFALAFTVRKRLSQYCIAGSLLLLSVCLLVPAIGSRVGTEFVSQREEELFFRAQFPGLLAALGLLLDGLLLTIMHWLDVVIRLMLFGLVAFALYIAVLFTVFSGMCKWTTSEILI